MRSIYVLLRPRYDCTAVWKPISLALTRSERIDRFHACHSSHFSTVHSLAVTMTLFETDFTISVVEMKSREWKSHSMLFSCLNSLFFSYRFNYTFFNRLLVPRPTVLSPGFISLQESNQLCMPSTLNGHSNPTNVNSPIDERMT